MRYPILVILLILLPFGYIESTLVRVIPLIFVSLGCAFYWLKADLKPVIRDNKILFFFSLIILVAIFRNSSPAELKISSKIYSALNFILFAFFYSLSLSIFMKKKKSNSETVVLNFIIMPFALFCVINWILYIWGIKVLPSSSAAGMSTSSSVLLAAVGIDLTRIEFPLVKGINSYSIYIGGALALSLPMFLWIKKNRLFTGFISMLFITTLICTDSRAALLYPIMITGFIYLIKRKKTLSKKFKLVPLLVIIGPMLFAATLLFINQHTNTDILSRGSDDVNTGSTRLFIWAVSLSEFLNFKPIHLVGYGAYGHYGSGASALWADLFTGYKDPEISASSHTAVFTMLFDYGYLGLIVYLSVLFQMMNRILYIWQVNSALGCVFLSFTFYNVIAGITEAVGGINLLNYLLLFFMTAICVNTQYYVFKRSATLKAI